METCLTELNTSLLVYGFVSLITGVGSLRQVELQVPLAALTGGSLTLKCLYDLEGDPLYTVKWYKGREEFFRFVPKEHPHTRVFPLPGVFVDVSESGPDHVTLRDVHRSLEGKYRCEVTTDAPDFHTQVVSAQVQVVDMPESAPSVVVEKSGYAVGDTLKASCSATRVAAFLPLNVTWLLNGQKVNESSYKFIKGFTIVEHLNMSSSAMVVVELETEVKAVHLQGGKLRLRCVASTTDIYSAATEVTVHEDRPRLASVLGTRESSSDSGGWCGFPTREVFALLLFLPIVLR